MNKEYNIRKIYRKNAILFYNIIDGNIKKLNLKNYELKNIPSYSFYNCNKLESIVLPESITSIGEDAFSGCSSLENVYYKGTMDQWNSISLDVFWNVGCPFTEIQCSDGNIKL